MEESAQDRAKSDSADALNWTQEERIFVQSAVRSNLVVVMHGLKPQSGSSVERQTQLLPREQRASCNHPKRIQ